MTSLIDGDCAFNKSCYHLASYSRGALKKAEIEMSIPVEPDTVNTGAGNYVNTILVAVFCLFFG